MAILPPLVTLSQAQSELAAVLPPNTSALSAVLDAASSQVRAYCRRDFTQGDYTDLLDGQGFSEIDTRQYPLNWITRLSVNSSTVLTVQNTDTVTNQRATAGYLVTGDYASGLTLSGLFLLRIASGVTYTDNVLFSGKPTVANVADAVTTLGNGWQGIATGGYTAWPTSDLLPTTGAQNALGSSGSAAFNAYVTDVAAYDFDPPTGRIRFRNQTFDPVFALMNIANTSQLSVFPLGWRGVRIAYNAGFATIPKDVQQATLVTIKEWMYSLNKDTSVKSESDVDYSYTLGEIFKMGLPDAAKKILQIWRSFREF